MPQDEQRNRNDRPRVNKLVPLALKHALPNPTRIRANLGS